MTRWIAAFLLLWGVSLAGWAEEPAVVTSWDHYRDLMIEDGKTDTEADRRIAELLGSLNGMDRAAGT